MVPADAMLPPETELTDTTLDRAAESASPSKHPAANSIAR
jgi:hypothetical protein